jgi:hypothetical protein
MDITEVQDEGQFIAKESDGTEHVIVKFQEYVIYKTSGGTNRRPTQKT